MKEKLTDNTVISNGIIKNDTFYPKKNLPSGTLRIVLTTGCNFKCKYCFAEGESDRKFRVLDLNKLKKVILIGKEFGITNVKLTGGEPLLYPHLEELLSYLREIKINYIDLTTNVSLLDDNKIEMLNKYGVNALTFSLDTLNKEKFEYLSGYNNFNLVKSNIYNAISKFNGNIRLNCIVFDYKFNLNDYNDIINFCKTNNLGLRLVEPSKVEGFPITYTKNEFEKYITYLKQQANKILLSDCQSVEYLFFENWYLTIMHSLCDNKLCSSCKEYMYMRVSSRFNLKPCLSRTDTEVNIDFSSDLGIRNSYIEAINSMGIGLK